MQLTDVKQADWSIDIRGSGFVVEGVEDVNQAIYIVLSTLKGSDPFRPNFGSDIWDYIDRPLPIAGPNMVRAITEAVQQWEPRIELKGVVYEYQEQSGIPNIPAGLVFTITWAYKGTDLVNELKVLLAAPGFTPTDIVIFRILATENFKGLTTEDGKYLQP